MTYRILIIGETPRFNAEYYYMQAFKRANWYVNSIVLDGAFWKRLAVTRTKTLRSVLLRHNSGMFSSDLRPDIILVIKGTFLPTHSLFELKKLKVPVILYYTDSFRFPVLLKDRLPLFDYVFTAAENTTLFESLGAKKIKTLPFACDPSIHKQPDNPVKSLDVSFIGTFYWRRYNILRKVNPEPNVFGNFWLMPPIRASGSGYSGHSYANKISETRVNLNIHNKADLLSGSINMRVFEVAGTGSFLLTDGNATKYFDKTSIGTFNDADDLSTKIRFYLEHEQIREDMAAKSREICYKYHTYDIRVESILKFIMY